MKTKRFLLILAACLLLPGLAFASASYDGTVVSRNPVAVTAPFGGMVGSVSVQEGDRVSAGDVLAEVLTTKVYAPTAGTVTGLFGQEGDSAASVVNRYGAVLYLTPAHKYTVNASSDKAYANQENMYVHLGEVVYLRSYNFQIYNTGMGVITAVSDSSFTVESTEGEFWMGETLSIYRDADYATESRIGRGEVTRTAEVKVGDTGSIVALHVQDGDVVQKGQLLYESVTGDLQNLVASGNKIVSSVDGVVESVNVTAGGNLTQGALVATICPKENMQVMMEINEYDLNDIQVGDKVSLTFNYDDTGLSKNTGTVQMISDVSFSTDTSDVTYNVYIDFTPDDNTRLGMTVMVDLLEDTEDAALTPAEDQAAQPATDAGDFMNTPTAP